jgi:hypothetical protein
MIKPNENFKLSVRDLEIIENALSAKVSRRAQRLMEEYDDGLAAELKEIRDLLGRFHNQKIFYRPKDRFGSGK